MVRQALLALAAAALGGVMLIRVADGSAAFLVQGWYMPILYLSAGLLMAVASVVALGAVRSRERWRVAMSGEKALAAALIALPIVVGIVFVPRPLGSASLDSESGGVSVPIHASIGAAPAAQRNVYQWAYEFQSGEPAKLAGQPVDLIGFVYQGKDPIAGQFRVARFVVACCVADASGVSVPVQWNDSGSLKPDSWVHIRGVAAVGGDGTPFVRASSVEPVEVPANPYIYP